MRSAEPGRADQESRPEAADGRCRSVIPGTLRSHLCWRGPFVRTTRGASGPTTASFWAGGIQPIRREPVVCRLRASVRTSPEHRGRRARSALCDKGCDAESSRHVATSPAHPSRSNPGTVRRPCDHRGRWPGSTSTQGTSRSCTRLALLTDGSHDRAQGRLTPAPQRPAGRVRLGDHAGRSSAPGRPAGAARKRLSGKGGRQDRASAG